MGYIMLEMHFTITRHMGLQKKNVPAFKEGKKNLETGVLHVLTGYPTTALTLQEEFHQRNYCQAKNQGQDWI